MLGYFFNWEKGLLCLWVLFLDWLLGVDLCFWIIYVLVHGLKIFEFGTLLLIFWSWDY